MCGTNRTGGGLYRAKIATREDWQEEVIKGCKFNKKNKLILPYVFGKEVLDIGVEIEDDAYYDWDNTHNTLRKAAKSVVGLEIDKNRQSNAIKKGFDVVLGDAQSFSLNKEFDVVVAGQLIEHLTNFDGFIRSIHKHLKPGGKFIIVTCNAFSINLIIRGFVNKRYAFDEHTCFFDEITLKQLFGRYGELFEIESFQYYNPTFNDPGMLFIRGMSRVNKSWSQDMMLVVKKI